MNIFMNLEVQQLISHKLNTAGNMLNNTVGKITFSKDNIIQSFRSRPLLPVFGPNLSTLK